MSEEKSQSMKTVNELDKWSEVHSNAVVIEEFLEFLSSKGIMLAKIEGDSGHVNIGSIPTNQELIYQCYGVDSKKLEQERRQLLENINR